MSDRNLHDASTPTEPRPEEERARGVLHDGTEVEFRPIRPADKELLAEGFRRLSPTSRYRRFFRHIDELNDAQLRYLTEVDMEDHVAWVALARTPEGLRGLGVARWIRIPGELHVAEAAVTVTDDYQGKGVGTTLLWLLARSAIERDVDAFRVWVQGENHPMLAILQELGATPKGWQGGVGEVDIPLAADPRDLPHPAALVLDAAARGVLAGKADAARATVERLYGADIELGERP